MVSPRCKKGRGRVGQQGQLLVLLLLTLLVLFAMLFAVVVVVVLLLLRAQRVAGQLLPAGIAW